MYHIIDFKNFADVVHYTYKIKQPKIEYKNGGIKMKWIKNLMFTLILSLALLLGACGSGVASNVDLSSYPETVQDGTVSVEYYKQVNNFYSESITYLDEITSIENSDENLSELLSEYNKALSSYTTKPKTKADEEVDFQLRKVIRFQTDLNNFRIEQIKTNNDDLKWDISTTAKMLGNMVKDLEDVADKYDISY